MYKDYFYGEKISEYGKKYGYVDYGTLANAVGNLVLCNDLVSQLWDYGTWEVYCGDSNDAEIFQWYHISEYGANLLKREAPDEIVFYNEDLNIYLWGITHFGTGWDYVLTEIRCAKEGEEEDD